MEMLASMAGAMAAPGAAMAALPDRALGVWELAFGHPWVTAGVITGAAYLWNYIYTPNNLPPGPMCFPLVGPVSCLGGRLEKKMLDWRKQYGDIVSFYKSGQLHIMLNSERSIRQAFVKQGEDFAHRPTHGPLAADAFGIADEIFAAPYNEKWKKNKKFAISTLKNFGFGTTRSDEKINAQLQLLEDILSKSNGAPIDLQKHCKSMTTAVISSILFSAGSSWDDPDCVALAAWVDEWYAAFNDYFAGGVLYYEILPVVPLLSSMMANKSHKKLTDIHARFLTFIVGLMKSHKVGIAEREADDVTDAYLKERGADDEMIKLVAGTIIIFLPDAIDTAATIDMWGLLYTLLNPEVQQRLHAEVDEICGASRLPTLADRPKMPYTQAVIHEVIRLVILAPMSAPRELHKDVTLNGYNLPKGAHVVANYYAIHFDPEIFPNPMKFEPSRFITAEGNFNSALGGCLATFALGPRKCIAELYFKHHMFLFITRILQRFSLEFDPNEPKPTSEADSTFFLTRPKGFNICFKKR